MEKLSLLRSVAPNVSRETFEKLQIYEALLSEQNKVHNFVGSNTINEIWTRHILDSAQLYSFLPANVSSLVDIGSGAGFPGMVLAILGVPGVVLVESIQKKCEFLRCVSRETSAEVEVVCNRIEKLDLKVDVVTSRAVASIDKLFSYASAVLRTEGVALFLKGAKVQDEIREAEKYWDFTSCLKTSITHEDGRICLMSNIHKKKQSIHNEKNYSRSESKRRGGKNNHRC